MTTEQWTLLSNIVHAYDQQNIVFNIKQGVNHESSLPVKRRTHMSLAASYISRFIQSVQGLFEECPHFRTLPLSSRRALMKNNLFLTGSVNGMIVGHEVGLWTNSNFGMSCDALFGLGFYEKCVTIPKRMDFNMLLFKMILYVLGFSSNYSVIGTNPSMEAHSSFDVVSVLQVQDVYVTLLWKYLDYQYGFSEAVLRYASLIKTVLDVLNCLDESANATVTQQSIGMAVSHIERLLIIDN